MAQLSMLLLEDRTTPVVGALSPAGPADDPLYGGVVALTTPDGSTCSGSLLYSGRHVLTAAHCVDDDGDGAADGDALVRFDFPDGLSIEMTVPPENVFVSDGWSGVTGDFVPPDGEDIALLELPSLAPAGLPRYDIYRESDELGRQFTLVGYGETGTGDLGSTPGTSGERRFGVNTFDADGLLVDGSAVIPAGLGLVADFDSGRPANDAFGVEFNINNTGVGPLESSIAPGDSGGPGLFAIGTEFVVAGVATFFVNGGDADIDFETYNFAPTDNSSFGDYFGYTRVSEYADGLDAILAEAHDLVIDMEGQPAGSDGSPDRIEVVAVENALSVFVNGQLYHTDEVSRVASLTVLGSGDVEEMVVGNAVPALLPVAADAGVESFDDTRPVVLQPGVLGNLTPGAVPAVAASPQQVFATGADFGASPEASLHLNDGSVRLEGLAYEAEFTGGVRVAVGDRNADGVPDLITAPGPGRDSLIRVFDGATGSEIDRFFAFEEGFVGGVFVAAADLNNDGFAEIIVSPDEGGGPRVRVLDGNTNDTAADFFGIEDPFFRGGTRIGVGDLNGDNVEDLLIGAGFGGGPRVALFDGASIVLGRGPVKLTDDFFAFEPSLRNGVYLTAGDLDGDGLGDIVAGGGPGGGPRVLAFGGFELLQQDAFAELANFFAGDVNARGGVRVAAKDIDGDSFADIVVGAGPGEPPVVARYSGGEVTALDNPTAVDEFVFTPTPGGGIWVG